VPLHEGKLKLGMEGIDIASTEARVDERVFASGSRALECGK